MKVFKLILFTSLLSACGEAPHIDPELQPYVNRFISEAQLRNIEVDSFNITVEFINEIKLTSSGYQNGLCDAGVVSIVRPAFEAQSDVNREIVLFHELGHCLLGRQHVDGVTDLPIPESLMIGDPTILDSYYSKNRTFYLNELFSQQPKFKPMSE